MRSHYYEAYRQIDRAITLDLGQLSHIESLSFHMQEGLGWGISAPSMVTYFLSEDGVTFHRVGRVSRFDAVKDEDPDHYYSVVENGKEVNCQSYYFTLDGLNYNARYVKVAFELTGTWALADELDVRGLHHGVRGFNGGDKAARFDHSKGIRIDIHCWFLRLS